MAKSKCKNCDKKIQVAIFKGSGYCSIDCKKALGDDVSSVGTHMFVTRDEKKMIDQARNNPTSMLVVNGVPKTEKFNV